MSAHDDKRALLEALVREMPDSQLDTWINAIKNTLPKRPGAKREK